MNCQHTTCDGELLEAPNDPLLPDFIQPYECSECGEYYEEDTRNGDLEIDA